MKSSKASTCSKSGSPAQSDRRLRTNHPSVMPIIQMTRELALAASLDAGNRAMRAAGRKRWSKQDQLAATHEFNRLWSCCEHGIEPESLCFFCDRDQIHTALPDTRKFTAETSLNH